ncbi:MAG: hypothetical protein ABIO05_06755, partial [Ferruginibacter sp.]
YYDKKYSTSMYGKAGIPMNTKNNFFKKRIPEDVEEALLNVLIKERIDQPIETPSENFSQFNYNLVAYNKTASWMLLLEREMGVAAFDSLMKAYYNQWKFKHPYPQDFKNLAEAIAGKSLDATFAFLGTTGALEKEPDRKIKLQSFFNLNRDQHYVSALPLVGANKYDKLMIGGMLHNYTLPAPNLLFFAAPLYSTGAKMLTGIARIGYHFFPGPTNARLEIALAGSRFSKDVFTDSLGKSHYLEFSKLVPSLLYTFKNIPGSTIRKTIQWKSFLINERNYLFTLDTTLNQYNITYPIKQRVLNQLNLQVSNSRKLYPYQVTLQAEKGKYFIKSNVTSHYFFNYAKGGGLQVRLFAGKFFYTKEKSLANFDTYRYWYNMTGANGFEDYTYSNYFIGRNEFEGLLSQQIMIKDGGFKIRTDLLSAKYGRSDDWLGAMNFCTTIPKKILPLPIKLFADLGTYAEAWDKDAPTGKFVYDVGLQLSVLKNVINIYFPLIYSKPYRDYVKSYIPEKRFQKNISFSIDVQNLNIKRFFPQSPF